MSDETPQGGVLDADDPRAGVSEVVPEVPIAGGAHAAPPHRQGGSHATLAERPAGRRPLVALVGLVVLVGASGLSLLAHPRERAATAVTTTSVRQLVCAPLAGGTLVAGVAGNGGAHLSALDGSGSQSLTATTRATGSTPRLLSPDGTEQPVGGTMATGSWAGCASPSSSATLTLADASQYELLLVNPDPTSVAVNLTVTGAGGVRSVAGARGLVVQPHGTRVVPLQVVVGTGLTGLVVGTDSGRVLAVARPVTTAAPGAVTAAAAARTTVLSALPAGSSATTLLLTNPGATAAAVDVAGLTGTGRIALAGAQAVQLPAQSSTRIDLTSAVAGQAMALAVTSDRPVQASAVVTVSGRQRTVPSGDLASQLVAVAPASGRLVLANPGTDAATVTVGGSRQVVPAGGLVAVTASRDAVVTVESTQPVTAAVDTGLTSGGVLAPAVAGATTGTVVLQGDPRLH